MYCDEIDDVHNFAIVPVIEQVGINQQKLVPKKYKNYEKKTIVVKMSDDSKYGKFVNKKYTIEQFGTGTTGSRIRNAVTGTAYPYFVGSKQEDLFFKIVDTTGKGKTEPLMLYYDNPEQYETHQYTVLEPKIKTIWNVKYICAKSENNTQ